MAVAWAVGAWANDSWLGMNAGPPNAWRGATTPTTGAITGTVSANITEADIVAGGKTIIITLANDTWVAAGATFNAQRQAIINGLDSAQAETFGWNTIVRDAEVVTAVVRTSDTVVTVTLSAAPTYDITAQETITVTVPSSALDVSASDVTGTPTFTVVAPADDARSGGWEPRGDPYGRARYPSDEDIRRQREELGILPKAAKVIAAVALRQADDLRFDSHQRLEELQRELALQDINLESRYVEALNIERARLIDAEIGARLQQLTADNEARLVMLLIALA